LLKILEIIFVRHHVILAISIIQAFVINVQVIAMNVREFQAPALNVIIPSFCLIVIVFNVDLSVIIALETKIIAFPVLENIKSLLNANARKDSTRSRTDIKI
jgi:hypothetical protein